MSGNCDLRLEVPCDASAPAAVRRALADRAQVGWGIGDAMLVASELVTNAVRHSGGREHDMVEVEACITGEEVRLAVSDPGASGSLARLRGDGIGFGGLGLRLVQALTSRWGAERLPSGRQLVWAEVPLDEDL